jgi:hypothetical protein
LKSALFRGGLPAETLQVLLTETDETVDASSHVSNDNLHAQNTQDALNWRDRSSQNSNEDGQFNPSEASHRHPQGPNNEGAYNSPRSPSVFSSEYGNNGAVTQQRAKPSSNEQRTLFISNLPYNATHKDLTRIIRGGRLLDIHVRKDNSAAVTFVEGAAEFLDYATKKGIEMNGHRLEVRWADRQFHLPDHVASKIAHGSTRNLIVRGAASKLSGNRIRDDMEHIHNLVVVDISFQKEDVFISLNSVHNALYARSCMMSRLPYKGSRIEFYPDECAETLPKPIALRKTSNGFQKSQTRNKAGAKTNIYALLEMDPSEASSDEEECGPLHSPGFGVSLDWPDSFPAVIAA